MKCKATSMSIAVALATAAPLLLPIGGSPLAKQPKTDADCVVGTAEFRTIQEAVDNANCHTIGVPAGTFRENVTIDLPVPMPGNISRTNITIRGAGPQNTTVDGSAAAGPVFSISGRRSAPCGEPEVAVTLERMTITGGAGPADCLPNVPCQRNGGGVSASPGVKLTVDDCIVTRNWAYMNGGGISVPAGRLTVVDSVISRNTAYGNPQPGVTDPNYVGGGGGLRVAGCPGVLVVKDSVIRDNDSLRHGGGVLINASPTATICVSNPAGGPCIRFTAFVPKATVVMTGAELKHNTAAEAWGGGGIYYNYADLTVLDSKIEHNAPDDVKQVLNP